MPAPATRHDPYKNFKFRVEIDGIALAGFAEVSGLSAEAEVVEYREGADITSTRKLPGQVKYPNVTLKRGITGSRELFDWWKTVVNGKVQRRSVAIILLDDDLTEVVRWSLHEAWIARIEFGDLEAEGNDVAIESIELAHERLDLES
jgi:phage tail-like protein